MLNKHQLLVPTLIASLLTGVLGFGLGISFQRYFFSPMPHTRTFASSSSSPKYTLKAFEGVNDEIAHLLAERFPGSAMECFVIPSTVGNYQIIFSSGECQYSRLRYSRPLMDEIQTVIGSKLAQLSAEE